jgi:protein tyrosine/serine phosphatase
MLPGVDTDWAPAQAYNWRDLGGLPTTDGGRTKFGRLFRSDTLQELDGADAQRLVDEVGLRTVVDLRLAGEVRREGRGPLEQEPTVRHLPVPLISVDLSVPGTAVPLITADMHVPHYLGFLDVSATKFRTIAETLADGGLPAVVHCAAGKDRTGVVVAVILDAVGVERSAIADDYVRTRESYSMIHRRLQRLQSYRDYIDQQPPEVLDASPEAINGFLEGLVTRFGSGAGYLSSVGVSDETLAELKTALVDA